jgi:prepilin peptidase CpaA
LLDPLLIGRAVLILACAAACWLDVTRRIIPNWLCAATLLAGLGFAAWTGGGGALGWHGLHAGVALLIGMAIYATGIIGGGDAKFYAAVAAWFSWSEGFRLLFLVSVAALAMFAVWFLIRRLRGIPVLRRAPDDTGKFPYALGIGGGAVFALLI